VTDGTVGTAGHLGAPQTLTGSDVKITQDMGTTAGHNVFQSFKEFNIGSGQTVTFTENSTNFVNNVIARVTGKETSNINGTLQVTPGGHANFYLLNPNGVMFGNGAHIDVPGDFHVTTAHFIKFQDGAKYGADPVHSHLSTTEPASFGFSSGTHSNNVLIDITDGAQLKNPTAANTAIDLVAQNIKIENGAMVSANDVRLVAAKGNTSVSLSHDVYGNLLLPKFSPSAANAGKVLIDGQDTAITSSTDGGGRVGIWGGNVSIANGAEIKSNQSGDAAPTSSNGVTVKAYNFKMVNKGIISSGYDFDSDISGNTSDVSIYSSGDVLMRSGSSIISQSPVWADNGDVRINSGGSMILEGYPIKSDTLYSGIAGRNVLLTSFGNIRAENNFTISSSSAFSSSILIMASGSNVSLSNGANLSSKAYTYEDNKKDSLVSISSKTFSMSGLDTRIDINAGINPRLNLAAEKGIYLSDRSSINVFSQGGSGIAKIFTHGGFIVQGNSVVNATNIALRDDGSPPTSGSVLIHSEYLYLNGGFLEAYTISGGALIRLDGVKAIFAIGNTLNGSEYPGFVGSPKVEGGIPTYDLRNVSPAVKNFITAINDRSSENIVVSGSLLNLSGDMANLPPANFKSKEIANSCEVANTGSLSLTGKGRTASSALDRLIYGY